MNAQHPQQKPGAHSTDAAPARGFGKLCADAAGTTAIEYALIAAGVSIVIVGVVSTLGGQLQTVFYDKLLNLF